MPDYIYYDKTGLYYLASRVFSDSYVGAPLSVEEKLKMEKLEEEFSLEIDQARCIIMLRDDLKEIGYINLLNYCAELLLRLRIQNKKEVNSRIVK